MTSHICTERPGRAYTCNCEIGRDHTRQERRDHIDMQLKGKK